MSTFTKTPQFRHVICLWLLILVLITIAGCSDPPEANTDQKIELRLEQYDSFLSTESVKSIVPKDLTTTLYSTYYKRRHGRSGKTSYTYYVQKTGKEKVQFSQSDSRDTTIEIRVLTQDIDSLPQQLTLRLPHTLSEGQDSVAELLYCNDSGKAAVLASLPFKALESSFFGLIKDGPYDLTAEVTNSAIYCTSDEDSAYFDDVLESYDIDDYFEDVDLSSTTTLAVITVKLERTEK